MSNLFILGNGFDRAHGMNTGYNDFREYLQEKYGIEDEYRDLSVPKCNDYYGADRKKIAEYLFHVFDINNCMCGSDEDEVWGRFEQSLSDMDFGIEYPYPLLNKDGSENTLRTSYANANIASDIESAILYISSFFEEWIKSIKVAENANKKIMKSLNEKDYVFSFNYTDTVENLYNIHGNHICHIHGKVGEDLIFGHGDDEDHYKRYMEDNVGTEKILSSIDMMLRKDVEKAMDENEYFFSLLKDKINKIYSIGFSYEQVDMPYINRFIDMFNDKNMVWIFDDYKREQTIRFENLIRKEGYIGEFSTFKMN